MPVIEVHDVHKRYDAVDALRGVSFAVERGEVFCLLGPNGAGKTTIAEILEGHRLPTSGSVRSSATTPVAATATLRARIGVVLQSGGIQEELTVGELLEMHGRWYPKSLSPAHLIDLVELDAKADAKAGELSGGQRRRLDLALGLVGDPDVLFLDEPTTGFDPHARRNAWSTLRTLCDTGKTIFLTTHFMDEAQFLADRVAVMNAGEIVAIGPPEALGGRDELPTEIRFALPEGVTPSDLPALARRGRQRGARRHPRHDGRRRRCHACAHRLGDRAQDRARASPSPSRRSRTSTSLTETATETQARS